jgi:hypothetical protein
MVAAWPVLHAVCRTKGAVLTKYELRVAAIRQLDVSRSSFDFAWIDAIERTGTSRFVAADAPKGHGQRHSFPRAAPS